MTTTATVLELEIRSLLSQAATYNIEAKMHQRDDGSMNEFVRHSLDMAEQRAREADALIAELKGLSNE